MWIVKCIINSFGEEWVSANFEFESEQKANDFAESEERSGPWDKVIVEEDN